MDVTSILLIIGGVVLFEIIVSVDNAIVNAHTFGHHIPHFISPLITFAIFGYFLLKSHRALKNGQIV